MKAYGGSFQEKYWLKRGGRNLEDFVKIVKCLVLLNRAACGFCEK